jgi:pimeloyl-ACP methyl ester carboxylesterase
MPRKKNPPKPVPPLSTSALEQAWSSRRPPQGVLSEPPPTVSGRWLLTAASVTLAAAAACAWLTLCILYWQGSWQLLYHPASAVARTPASVGLAFDPVAFAATEDGEPLLKGWWIPAAPGAPHDQYTVLYLHGQTGNLGDTVDDLAALHAVGVNILAFDYRGYGQSLFSHPSEARWRQDAEWALEYLTATRHVPAGAIVVDGSALGANLALEIAAAHPQLAGAVLQSPLAAPVDAIFHDPRSRLVPAHLLVRDRFDTVQAAAALRIPSLWFETTSTAGPVALRDDDPGAYHVARDAKMLVWLTPAPQPNQQFLNAWSRWLDNLPARSTSLQR